MRRTLVAGWLVTVSCGGHEGPNAIPVRDVAVNASATSLVVGATTQLTAVVTGTDGNVIASAPVTWSSVTPTVLTVSASGIATAMQAGQGTARAASGGRSGDVTITVKNPPVASMAFDRDSTILTLPAGNVTLAPVAKDAGGHTINNPTFFYSTDSPKVATVTQLGVITAVAAGVATVSASADGVTATVRVRVTATVTATSPRITIVTPMLAGASATITGSNFSSSVGGNTVLVEGVTATVTAATATQLSITLPSAGWPCAAERPVSLQVNTNNESGVATASLRTAVPRTLAVGQSLVLTTASDARCNEVSKTGGKYLVTVYNPVRTAAGTQTSFTLRGAVSVPQVASDVVAAATTQRALPDYATIGTARFGRWLNRMREEQADEVHARVMQRSLEYARANRADAASRRQRALTEPAVPVSPSFANQVTTVGAITPLKIPNLDAANFCSSSIAVGARTAWVGQHAVIVEDTISAINGVPTLRGQIDSLYAQLGQEFDTVMWPILTQNFGNPMAMDQQLSRTGKVVMLFSPRVNAMQGGFIAGYVVSCDFFPSSQSPSSNVGEYFYAISPTSLAAGRGQGTRDTWLWGIRSTIIHEVKHITSFAERLSRNAPFEELWLEEGLARHAEEQYARGIYGVPWKGNTGYLASLWCDVRPASPSAPQCAGRPDLMRRHLDALYVYLLAPEGYTPFGSTTAGDATYYASAWSVVRWMMDQYAATEAGFLTQMVQSSLSGVANLEARTGKTWEEMLGEWALSLYTDDYPGVTFANPRLQFPSWNLRDQFAGLCGDFGPCLGTSTSTLYPVAFPLVPRATAFGAFADTIPFFNAATFTSWLISGTQSAPQILELRGSNGGDPPSTIRLAIVRLQ